MQNRFHFRKSFIRRRILEFAGCVLLMFLAFFGLERFIENRSMESFPTVYDLIDYEDQLLKERYDKIPVLRQKSCDLIVYDSTGTCVYSTDEELNKADLYQKRYFIPVLYGDYYYYLYTVEEEGQEGYLLERITLSEDGKEVLDGYCTLDQDRYVTGGTMWTDHGRFDRGELALFEGYFHDGRELSQYSFVTEQGEERTLFFVSPEFDVTQYLDRYSYYERYLYLIIPLGGLILLIYAFSLKRGMNRAMKPLVKAMDQLGNGARPELDETKVVKEYVQVAETFNSMMNRLEKVDQEREEAYQNNQRIITNLAHDLKTPMTVIQGYTKALLEHDLTKEKQREYLESIYSKSSLCNDQAVTLFEYARFQHPEYQMPVSRIDLAELCSEYLADKYMEIENKNCELDAEISEEPLWISGNSAMLFRMLNNLVDNSIKYNPEGTTIHVTLKQAGAIVELIVGDDGVGINEEFKKKLFLPFVIGDEARSSGKGNGLGLVIAKKVAEMHAGSLEIMSDDESPYKVAFKAQIPLLLQDK